MLSNITSRPDITKAAVPACVLSIASGMSGFIPMWVQPRKHGASCSSSNSIPNIRRGSKRNDDAMKSLPVRRTRSPRGRAPIPAAAARTAIFTTVSRNYIAYAATLMQTVARHHPEAARYVFLADADYDFSELDLPATVVTADRINIANFSQMAFRYTIIELNTAIKPFCVRWLFNDQHHVRAIYLDPDIYVDIPNHLFTDQRWMDLAPAFVPNTAILHHPGYNLAYWNLLHRPVTRGRGGWRAGGEPLHFVHFSAVDPLKPGEFSKHQTRFRTENLGGLRTLFETYVAQLLANGYEKYAKLPYAYGLLQRRSRGACSDAALFSSMRGKAPPSAFRIEGECALQILSLQPELVHDSGDPRQTRPLHLAERVETVCTTAYAGLPSQMVILWENRRDLQLAFPLAAPEDFDGYVAWCITNGIAEGHIDPELIDERFWELLDAPAALNGDHYGMPITRGLWAACSAYDWREIVARFPQDKQSRTTLALWFLLEAPRKYRWPAAMTRSLRAYADAPVPAVSAFGVPLPRVLLMLWENRADLRSTFDLAEETDRRDLFGWYLFEGLTEYGLSGADLPDELSRRLFTADEHDQLPPIQRLVRWRRPDIEAAYDAGSEIGRQSYFLPAWETSRGAHLM